MLYFITLAVIFIWMVVLFIKRKTSWHSLISAYSITLVIVDFLEVIINLILGTYKFPVHLTADPIDDNQMGIIFADTLILPFTFIVYMHYADKSRPWRTTIPFATAFVILEWIFVRTGYMKYVNWHLGYSAFFYVIGFLVGVYLAVRLMSYDPPVPYPIRLFCLTYTAILWIGAIFGGPVLKWYLFKPGIFGNVMADDRFADLYSGFGLAFLCAGSIPFVAKRWKLPIFSVITGIGVGFALYAYSRG